MTHYSRTQCATFALMLLTGGLACAESGYPSTYTLPYSQQQHANEQHNPGLRFQFDASRYASEEKLEPDFLTPHFYGASIGETVGRSNGVNQYEATLSYPFNHQHMAFGVGVNIKRLSGNRLIESESGSSNLQSFDATLPMLYANALFQLPFQGLAAGVEGSHYSYDKQYGLEYKAKVSYDWGNGLGLEGGWQHQQYSLDNNQQDSSSIEDKGVFLDLFMRF